MDRGSEDGADCLVGCGAFLRDLEGHQAEERNTNVANKPPPRCFLELFKAIQALSRREAPAPM
jgi:hypothetical protein